MVTVEPYGSAKLLDHGTKQLDPIFTKYAMTGCAAIPLGNNHGDLQHGYTYQLTPNGAHKGHAITFGRTRGGKGVSSIIPALLTYAGSMVVIDPKGENAWLTAERRRAMGHRVVILDPWGEVNRRFGNKAGVVEPVTKFNPLSAVDPQSPDFADDIAALADSLILRSGHDPHWPDSARELVGGLMAAEIQHRPGKASLRGVRKLLTAPIDDLTIVVKRIIERFPGTVAARKLASVIEVDGNSKETSSVRSTARTQTAFLDSARLVDAMETDETPFDMRSLATSPVTLYLVLPVDRLATHGRWLRLLLTLAIRDIAKADTLPKYPVLFLLDELGTISPGNGLSMVEQSFGLMAGLGIRIWAFLQDLPQLKRDYPESWETFISNSSIIQLLNVADNTTAEYFSTYLGNATVNAKTGEWSRKYKPWEPGKPQLYERQTLFAREYAQSQHGLPPDQAKAAFQHIPGYIPKAEGMGYDPFPWITAPKTLEQADLIHKETKRLEEIRSDAHSYAAWKSETQGEDLHGFHVWEPETQLMSRPVLYPWEIVNAAPEKTIIIVPGGDNFHLDRIVYYSHPQLSHWARRDPNRP